RLDFNRFLIRGRVKKIDRSNMMLAQPARSSTNVRKGEEIVILSIDLFVVNKHGFCCSVDAFDQGRGTDHDRQFAGVEKTHEMRRECPWDSAMMNAEPCPDDLAQFPSSVKIFVNPF